MKPITFKILAVVFALGVLGYMAGSTGQVRNANADTNKSVNYTDQNSGITVDHNQSQSGLSTAPLGKKSETTYSDQNGNSYTTGSSSGLSGGCCN